MKPFFPTFLVWIMLALVPAAWSEEATAKGADPQTITLAELQAKAKDGDSTAQFRLGTLYASGQGVPQDDAEALKWYRLSAEQGNARAQSNLGVFYAQGRGLTPPAKSSTSGFTGPSASSSASPIGTPRKPSGAHDRVEAYKWFQLAAEQGLEGAAKNRDRIAAHMTPEQIAEAKRRVEAFTAEFKARSEAKPPAKNPKE